MSALVWIKLLHTGIFVVESPAILYILFSGVFNIHGPVVRFASLVAGVPLAILGMAFALWVALRLVVYMRSQPHRTRLAEETFTLPEELAPALAGALVVRQLADAQIAATQLQLAQRGALQSDPRWQTNISDPSTQPGNSTRSRGNGPVE